MRYESVENARGAGSLGRVGPVRNRTVRGAPGAPTSPVTALPAAIPPPVQLLTIVRALDMLCLSSSLVGNIT